MKLGSEQQLTPSPLRRRSSLQPSLTGSQQSSEPSEEALSTVRACRQLPQRPTHAFFSFLELLFYSLQGCLSESCVPQRGDLMSPGSSLAVLQWLTVLGNLCVGSGPPGVHSSQSGSARSVFSHKVSQSEQQWGRAAGACGPPGVSRSHETQQPYSCWLVRKCEAISRKLRKF